MIGYIAKDRDNQLFLYDEKPEYEESIGQWVAGEYMFIEDINIRNNFKDLSYTDEPIKVEINIKRV